MLSSSTTCICNKSNNLDHKAPSSSTTKPSSLPSHFSHLHNKTMGEDVWKGINLASLSGHTTHTASTGAKFQDFLGLSLSTRPEFQFDPLLHKDLQLAQSHHNPASKVEPFRRDTRNARLMKNRESAARSRARKQAYVFELKEKIKHLQEENARLRRQQRLLRETAGNQVKRGNLYRTYTAPF